MGIIPMNAIFAGNIVLFNIRPLEKLSPTRMTILDPALI